MSSSTSPRLQAHPDFADSPFFVHESSYIDANVRIGDGTTIWHFSHVMPGVTVGKQCRIGQNVVISANVTVGNNVKIQNNVSVYTGVTLEDDVFCGPSMVFTNVFNPRSSIPRNTEADFLCTRVKKGASLGANTTIVCGVTIGQYAFIGAGAVVTRDIPDFALVYGNPARQHGWMCVCGDKLPDFPRNLPQDSEIPIEMVCTNCHREYLRQDNLLTIKSAS